MCVCVFMRACVFGIHPVVPGSLPLYGVCHTSHLTASPVPAAQTTGQLKCPLETSSHTSLTLLVVQTPDSFSASYYTSPSLSSMESAVCV